ncbi:hypothetical protein C8J56DRAFT_882000 [Mycena floridula]|nr:hypothetical protein C8J56DRAFT_882000 [Mycena floridula]
MASLRASRQRYQLQVYRLPDAAINLMNGRRERRRWLRRGFHRMTQDFLARGKMPEEYKLYGCLRPLVFEELEDMKLKDNHNPFWFPSTFPEPSRRLYSYLLEPERSKPDWSEWIHNLYMVGCPAVWTREEWLDAWRSVGSSPGWTTRVMIRFPWDIQYIQGGFCATVKFSYAAYDAFHDVIFLHPVSVVIEEDRVVEYAMDGIDVMMSFPEEEEE